MPSPRVLALVLVCSSSGISCGGGTAPSTEVDVLPHPAPAPFGGQVCSGKLCWYGPLPTGASVRALWGSAFDDVWAAGDALLHFDGNGWSLSTFPLAAGEQVTALSGTSKSDVWAGGDRLLHYDGSQWTEQPGLPDGNVLALAAWSGGVLAIIDNGNGPDEKETVVEKRGAGAWTTVVAATAPDLRTLWVAPDGGEAWVGGLDLGSRGSRLLHRTATGAAFTNVTNPGQAALVALWGTTGDLWTAGIGTLLHWNGAAWTLAPGIDPKAELRALWGSGPSDIYAAERGGALHYDGASWKQALPPAPGEQRLARAVWGSGPRNLWLAGDAGLLWQGDKVTFTDATASQFSFLEAVSASSAADAWAVGGAGTAVHWDGHYWNPTTTSVSDPLQAVYAAGPGDAWAAGTTGDCQGYLLHWNGAKWLPSIGPDAGRCYTGLSGTSGHDIWAVASNVLLHFDGGKWQSAGPADPAQAVFAAAPGEVFALQDSTQGGPNLPGGIWHLKGGTWTLEKTKSAATLRALWGSGPSDVWACGDDATSVVHFDGSVWKTSATGVTDGTPGLGAVWGSGAGDAWFASRAAPLLLHFHGGAFTQVGAGAGFRSLSGIGGSGAGDVWLVGTDGTILHQGR